MHFWSSLAILSEPRRPGLVEPPGFHKMARGPMEAPALQKRQKNKIQRVNPREKNEILGGERKTKRHSWARREGSRRRGSGGRRSGRGRVERRAKERNRHKGTGTHHETSTHTLKCYPHVDPHKQSTHMYMGSLPKSVWAKVGRTTETLTLARVGVGQSRPFHQNTNSGQHRCWSKSAVPPKH